MTSDAVTPDSVSRDPATAIAAGWMTGDVVTGDVLRDAPVPDLVRELGLAAHPSGGWFRQTWHSDLMFSPEGYSGPRRCASAIYYLLGPGERSAWHLVRSDEIWLWHSGGPLTLKLGGIGETPDELAAVNFTLGTDLTAGQHPQVVVPGGVWQSATPAGTEATLVSCVVAPGFEAADFRTPLTGTS